MKKLSVLLILFGSGLAAYGISGFSGDISNESRLDPAPLDGSFAWPTAERLEIVVGVVSLAGGLILRKESN